MDAPAHPSRSLIVNMPVADVERSAAFFLELGFGVVRGPVTRATTR